MPEWREKMVEAAAEANDELMEKYLEQGELTIDEIKRACGFVRLPMRSPNAVRQRV